MADEKMNQNNKIMAAASYLLMPLSSVAFYLIEKEDKIVRFHAVQSTILGVLLILISFPISILIGIVSVFTRGIGLLLFPLYFVVVLALIVFLMFKAYKLEKYMLPVIGKMAEKYSK
ncbi:MAG: hypothetical protein ABH950_08870 [Candidatus Altiarchaeota archaeon]